MSLIFREGGRGGGVLLEEDLRLKNALAYIWKGVYF